MKTEATKPPAPATADVASIVRVRILAAVSLLAFVVVFFFNLPVYFVTDDLMFLEKTLDVGLAAALDPAVPRNFYRPLTQDLYFRALFPLFGMRPPLFHLVNFSLIGLNLILIFRLARRLTGKIEAAAWSILLSVATMINFRVYFWISCIQDILMTTLALAAVLCFMAGRDRGPRARAASIAGPVCFGLSLLAKESALLLPLWLWILDGMDGGRRDGLGRMWMRHLGFDLMFVGFLLFSLVRPLPLDNPYHLGHPLWMVSNLDGYLNAIWLTLGLGAFRPEVVGKTGVAVGLVVLVGLGIRRARGKRLSPPTVLGLAWFALGVLIFLPLANRIYAYYISFAAIGVWWAVGDALSTGLARLRPKTSLVFTLLATALVLVTGIRNYLNFNQSYLKDAAWATGKIHRQLQNELPDPAPGQCFVIYTQLDLDRSDLIGLRALYRRTDLRVFVDRQAWQDLPDGRNVRVRPEFKDRGCLIFFFDEQRGLMPGR